MTRCLWWALVGWGIVCLLLTFTTPSLGWNQPLPGNHWRSFVAPWTEQATLLLATQQVQPTRAGPIECFVRHGVLRTDHPGPPCPVTHGPPGPRRVLSKLPVKPATQSGNPAPFLKKFRTLRAPFQKSGFCNRL